MEKVYLNLFLIAGSVVCTLACLCENESQQDRFCNREFGALVHVVGEDVTFPSNNRAYKIRFDEMYYCKLPAGEPINKTILLTPSNTCGIMLQNDTSYMVSGRYDLRRQVHYLSANICDYLDPNEQELPVCSGDM